ncbi:hypothetical protein [Streptomyces sp. NRRL WC-3725]|uniref:hypothetical protein n=1 Tax=Streptomyces sp. NRRL WC-3725 TaxID=1463933 RepID=UPI0004C72675|nr:hypothetical protein [Streptomyces sp. NRRL WC-3725]
MPVRSKLFAAVAILTAVGGLGTAGTVAADAATAECGDRCIQIYSAEFGTAAHPDLVETVHRGVAAVGQATVMRPVSTTDPAGDIVGHRAGPVSDFYKDGLVSAEVNRHYGNLRAVEVEYAPHGEGTGLCAGLATTAYQNEGLTLQKCGTSGRTVWIIDTADSPATAAQKHFPLVNGSTTDFTHPYAMTFTHASPRHGHSGDRAHRSTVPGQIRVARLMGNPSHVPAGQLWGTMK